MTLRRDPSQLRPERLSVTVLVKIVARKAGGYRGSARRSYKKESGNLQTSVKTELEARDIFFRERNLNSSQDSIFFVYRHKTEAYLYSLTLGKVDESEILITQTMLFYLS